MSELQFDRAEFAQHAPERVQCAVCNQDVIQSYYEVGGRIICSGCCEELERGHAGFGSGRFFRAFFAGLGVAAAGSVVWYAIRALTGYEFGLISIFVGIGVGKAVMWGSRGKGGWLYQLMAVALTYTSAVTNYTPDLVADLAQRHPELPLGVVRVTAFIMSFALPFFLGFENIIGILIIAFGLYEAWKFTRRVDAVVTGPYSVAPAAPPAAPAANV